MTRAPPTLGLILAGGRARRMGGGDKALLPIAGQTILAHAIDRLRPQCAGLLLNANGDADRFAVYGLPVVADSVPGFPGPLAGILAGLEWAAAHRGDLSWVVSIAADGPFVPRDLVARLHAERNARDVALVSAASGEHTHPATGLWPTSLAPALRAALVDDGERAVHRFTARYATAIATWPATPVDPFFNINTPADLSEAERLALAHPDA